VREPRYSSLEVAGGASVSGVRVQWCGLALKGRFGAKSTSSPAAARIKSWLSGTPPSRTRSRCFCERAGGGLRTEPRISAEMRAPSTLHPTP
jgi:hypothetical protein